LNQWCGIPILHSDLVEPTVVDAKAKTSSWLLNKQDRRRGWRRRRADKALLEVLLEVVAEHFQFFMGHAI
jgi:hypothetical protein